MSNIPKRTAKLSSEGKSVLLAQLPQKHTSSWNNAQVDPNVEPCIHEMFEAQVKRTPDAIAVVFALEHLTYLELNARRLLGFYSG